MSWSTGQSSSHVLEAEQVHLRVNENDVVVDVVSQQPLIDVALQISSHEGHGVIQQLLPFSPHNRLHFVSHVHCRRHTAHEASDRGT